MTTRVSWYQNVQTFCIILLQETVQVAQFFETSLQLISYTTIKYIMLRYIDGCQQLES